jgi:Bacterial capsule synthesis protein PGA_cap
MTVMLRQACLASVAAVIALAAGAGVVKSAPRLAPCASSELTASTAPAPVVTRQGPDRLTIVLVGDAGCNSNGLSVDPRGVHKDGAIVPFKDTLSGVASDIDGDLAFVNLETVITDRNDLPPDSKGQTAPYNFRSHPLGLKALVDDGFNLISLAIPWITAPPA